MKDKIRMTEELFTPEERERIKNALYRIFLINDVAVVRMFDDELIPYTIKDYALLYAGIKKRTC